MGTPLCGDYKSTVNNYLADVKDPLPRIVEIFATLKGDLFYQIEYVQRLQSAAAGGRFTVAVRWEYANGSFQRTFESLLR